MSRTEILRDLAAITLLATVLTACGAGAQAAETGGGNLPPATPAAAATTAPAPAGGALDLDGPDGLCAILPADRASAAIGEPVGPAIAKHSVTFSNASCTYDSTESDASITIWFYPGMTRPEWESAMAKVGMTADMAVPGLGDAAYRRDSKTAPARVKLAVYEGDDALWVNITSAGTIPAMAASAEREARDLLAAIG